MNYATIKYYDIANGPGVRTSVFVSGCRHHCPGCFNAVAWDFHYGQPFDKATRNEVFASCQPDYIAGLSLLGGEPMEPENQEGLVAFVERVRDEFPRESGKTIWCFTGDTWDVELVDGGRHHTEFTDRILRCVDVLVDGPFVQDLHDITLRFRGSSNQRLIDMPATLAALAAGEAPADAVRLWRDAEVYAAHSM